MFDSRLLPHIFLGVLGKRWHVHHFTFLKHPPPHRRQILNSEIYLAPRILVKGLWRIFNWEYNCKYNFIHRGGGKVYILVISENKILVFGIFRCGKPQYVEIICLGNMKEIGCSKIRTENFAIKKHGRKWLHIFCAWDESRIAKQEPSKGKQHRPKLLTGWGLHAFSLSVPYI